MKHDRRTQAQRTAATREALIAAARPLFAAQGFAAVSAQAIVAAAGLTRGALYHHFTDKADLFAAVFEAVEADLIARIGAAVEAASPADPISAMRVAAAAWLDVAAEPDITAITLVEGPAALGWTRWREIGSHYSLSLAEGLIAQAIAAGALPDQPTEPLAYVLLGAVREAALYMAAAEDRRQARREVGAALDRLIGGLG